jgi:hypothetical protein
MGKENKMFQICGTADWNQDELLDEAQISDWATGKETENQATHGDKNRPTQIRSYLNLWANWRTKSLRWGTLCEERIGPTKRASDSSGELRPDLVPWLVVVPKKRTKTTKIDCRVDRERCRPDLTGDGLCGPKCYPREIRDLRHKSAEKKQKASVKKNRIL